MPRPADEERRERAARKNAKLAQRADLSLRYGEAQRRWYFGKLELHPVKLNLTFKANNNWGESTGSLPIPNIEGAPIWLSALLRQNLYGTADELVVAIVLFRACAQSGSAPARAARVRQHAVQVRARTRA